MCNPKKEGRRLRQAASEQVIWAELGRIKEQAQEVPRLYELFEKIQQDQQHHDKQLLSLRRFSKQVEQHLEQIHKGALPPRHDHQQTVEDGSQGVPQSYVPGASASSSAVPLTPVQMPSPPTVSPPPIPTFKDQSSSRTHKPPWLLLVRNKDRSPILVP